MHPNTEAIAARIAWENVDHDVYAEHVVQKSEFSDPLLGPPVEINTRLDFKEHVAAVLESPETQCFTAYSFEQTWRQADIYYHLPTNTAVVVPEERTQSPTAFRPENGPDWFAVRLNEAREIEPALQIQQGGISALHPGTSKTLEAEKPMLADMLFVVDETAKATGEFVSGVAEEVGAVINDYTVANPSSTAPPAQQQEAAYAALSVDDPVKYPPTNDEMKAFVEDRRASEAIGLQLREASGVSLELSPEEQQAQMQDRMQSYIDQQKQFSMSM